MNTIDTAIEQYNKKLSFFNRKKKIIKKEGDFLFGEIKDTKEPFILNNSKFNTHAYLFGKKERINETYLSYIFQQIENDEPFMFINNIYSNFNQLSGLIKEHAKKYNYSYEIKIEDYLVLFDNKRSIKDSSYIFNLIDYSQLEEDYFLEMHDNILLNYDININIINEAYFLLLTQIINDFLKNIGIPLYSSQMYKNKKRISIIIGKYIPITEKTSMFTNLFAQGRGAGFKFITSIDTDVTLNEEIQMILANCSSKFLFTENCSDEAIHYISTITQIPPEKIKESNYFYDMEKLIKIK